MRIALISPRLALQKGDFLGSGVPYWPLDLAVFAAFLQKQHHSISVFDLFGEDPKSLEDQGDHYLQGVAIQSFFPKIESEEFDLVIIYAISSMSHQEVLSILYALHQQFPEIPLVVQENSQAVTAYSLLEVASELFEKGCSWAILGEAYWNWHEIEKCFKDPLTPPPENLISSQDTTYSTKKTKTLRHSSYPFPAWELFPIKNYWKLPYSHGPKTPRYLPILTSRGCPYPCDFCVVPTTNNRRWRDRSPEEVVEEIIYLRDRFQVRDFQIEDLNPSVHEKRWDKICHLLIEKEAGIRFYLVSGTKAETLKVEKVDHYAKAGCRFISISPESGSPQLMHIIGKRFNYNHGLKLIEACKCAGISTQACLIVGHPQETEQDHQQSCQYLEKLLLKGLDEVGIFIISPIAGSQIYKKQQIPIDYKKLLSFSPKGRDNWDVLKKRRKELLLLFFKNKLLQGSPLWIQGIRALLGRPKTKMENLPLRVLFIYWLILSNKLKYRFTQK